MLVTRNHLKLTLAGARVVLAGAEARAGAIGVPMDIAVMDEGMVLLAFIRMDDAKLTSAEIAINKAFTAAGTRKATHEYAQVANAGGPAFGINSSHGGRFTVFGGGLPIVVEGQTIGAVGCSSGSAEQDREVAQAGIDALLAALRTAS
jgi:uncharacterized protein GlcG (DUF336 family)